MLGDGPGRDGIDPRYLRSHATWELTNETAPLTALMHDRPPWSIEEDCELVDLDLCSYTLEWHARVPSWRDHYLGLDQRRHYAFLRQELQVLSYLRGPNRWVLKTPQHLEQLGPLLDTFPDATIAFTLRDPVAVLQSAITMLAYGDRMRRVRIDADELAAYWIDRIERLLRAAVRDAHLIPERQRVDVEFGEFMADDLAMAAKILDVAGLELTDAARGAFEAYLAGNPRGQGRPRGLRPPRRLRDRARRAARAVRVLLRGVPADPPGGRLMAGIHRERPGADAIAAAAPASPRSTSATASGCRRASRTATCSPTDDGPGDRQHRHGLRRPAPPAGVRGHRRPGRVHSIILTQGHYDHVGGVDVLREPGTDVVVQANFATWRADNERLETFRARNAAFAWMDAIVAAMQYARVARRRRRSRRRGPSRR